MYLRRYIYIYAYVAEMKSLTLGKSRVRSVSLAEGACCTVVLECPNLEIKRNVIAVVKRIQPLDCNSGHCYRVSTQTRDDSDWLKS
jgi:hypothetical protein